MPLPEVDSEPFCDDCDDDEEEEEARSSTSSPL